MDLDDIDRLFASDPCVDEQMEDTRPVEDLGTAARAFAYELVRVVPAVARRRVLASLVALVVVANEAIRAKAKQRDRGRALADRAEAQIP
jgi:hypothetical protein